MEKKSNKIFIVLASILIIIFSASISPIDLQNDTFYTIKIGEFITQNGLDVLNNKVEPFTWHENINYTYPHWAYDTIVYIIFNAFGFLGIYISTILLACILGLSIFFVNRKITKNNLTSFVLTLGAMFLLKPYIAARAQLVTFILFIWTIYFIEQFLQTKKKRYAIGLITIPIVIANIHSAVWPFFFILFLPYIGEYIVSYIPEIGIFYRKIRIKLILNKIEKNKAKDIEKSKNTIISLEEKNEIATKKNTERKKHPYKIIVERNKNVKWLILIFVICLFTGLLTPIGDSPYTYVVKIMQGNTMEHINEHLPLTLINSKAFLVMLVMFLSILIFTDTKIKLRDLFMSGGLLYMAFSTRRQMSMFILICSVILNKFLCALFDKYDPKGCKKMQLNIVSLPGNIITIALVLIISLYSIKPLIGDKFINEKSYPVAASDYILENIDVSKMRIFNEYNYGSYLLYRGIPVFIDSRSDLYTPQFNGDRDIFIDALNISSLNTYYENKFKEYKITHVITKKNTKLNMFLSRDNNYKKLYSDDNFYFYERLSSN